MMNFTDPASMSVLAGRGGDTVGLFDDVSVEPSRDPFFLGSSANSSCSQLNWNHHPNLVAASARDDMKISSLWGSSVGTFPMAGNDFGFNNIETVDELKQKLLYTSLELEAVRAEANDELQRNKDSIKQLLHLLKMACQERDQLQKLILKFMPQNQDQIDIFTPTTTIPYLNQPGSPLILQPTKANSSITESNSFSDHAYNNHHGNSDSLFDSVSVSSPEFSNINTIPSNNIASQPFVAQDYSNINNSGSAGVMAPNGAFLPPPHRRVQKYDQAASMVMEKMVRGKKLPQKGRLLQAVLEAGPLLQTLLLAGPIPRWRNPPPLQTSLPNPTCYFGMQDARAKLR